MPCRLHPPLIIFSQHSLMRNHFGPSLETYFPTLLQSFCCNSTAVSPLNTVLPAVGLEGSFPSLGLKARSSLSTNEGCAICPLLSHPFWSLRSGGGVSSLQVAAWFIGANSPPSTLLLFCKSQGSIMVIWKTHDKHLLRCGDSLSFRITFVYCWPTLVYEILICVFIPVCLLTYVTIKMAPFYFQPLPWFAK